MGSNLFPNRDRLFWVITIAVGLAAVFMIFLANEQFYQDFQTYFSTPAAPRRPAAYGARLTIDFNNGQTRAFAGEIEPGMTVLSALRASEIAGAFSALTDERGRVVEIAGLKNRGAARWQVYLNELPLGDLPGHIEIQTGDVIVFRYE